MPHLTTWPEYVPDQVLKIDFTNGSMTLAAGSRLRNYGDYDMGAATPETKGEVWKNGSKQGDITIDAHTRALTISSVSVSSGDDIEFRMEFTCGHASAPWDNKIVLRRTAFLEVSGNNEVVTFDASTNAMPVPTWRSTFGWDASDNFKWGIVVDDDDSASQDMTLWTRLVGTTPDQESSSTIDLDTTNTQTHVSSFDKTDVDTKFEVETLLKSGTGTTRQETRCKFVFNDVDEVPSYSSSFPSDDVLLDQVKVKASARIGEP